MIFEFIKSGLEKVNRPLHPDKSTHSNILAIFQEMNCLLNEISPGTEYETYVETKSSEITIRLELFFNVICSKYICPNLWPLIRRLMSFQSRQEIARPDYRDHVLHSVQNVLLGFALIGHDAKFSHRDFEMPTLFMALAYHDLGYIEQIRLGDLQEPGTKPVLEVFFRDALLSISKESDLVVQNFHIDTMESVLCLNLKLDKLDQLRRAGILNEIATTIWATEPSYEEEHMENLLSQMGLKAFPFKHYKAWKEKDRRLIPREHFHSLASAMLLFKIVSTRKYIVDKLMTMGTLGDPHAQISFANSVYAALKPVFLHDFDLFACPETKHYCEQLKESEIFVITVDELQTYGRPSHNTQMPYPALNPALAGYRMGTDRKLILQIARSLREDISNPDKPAYYHTSKVVGEFIQKKVGDFALDFFQPDEITDAFNA